MPDDQNNERRMELITLICQRSPAIADLILRGLMATMEHNRPSNITLALKIARNADDPRLIEVTAQDKITAPKSRYSDLKSWDEIDMLKAYRLGEDHGQEVLPGVEDLTVSVRKLQQVLEENGASMTLRSGDGKEVTLGGKGKGGKKR